jgi:hypothetical protein
MFNQQYYFALVEKQKEYDDLFPRNKLGYERGHSAYETFIYKLYFVCKAICINIEPENEENIITSAWKLSTGEKLTVINNDPFFTKRDFPYMFEKRDSNGHALRDSNGMVIYDNSWMETSNLYIQLKELKLV